MLRNVQEITRATDLFFCPPSALYLYQKLRSIWLCKCSSKQEAGCGRSLLCACWHTANTNKNPASVAQFIPCAFLNYLRVFFICFIFFTLSSCENYDPSHRGFSKLEQIKSTGTLNVLIRNNPTIYYRTLEGTTGLEYELVTLFAKHLDVKVNFIVPNTFDDVIKQISENKADIAAAGLTITEKRKTAMRFAPSYQTTTEQVIYRSGRRRPKNIVDLNNGILEIAKGTSFVDSLIRLQTKYPKLSWNTNSELTTDGLIYLVNEGLIDYTIADSHEASSMKRFYPKLNIAFDISKPRQLAWALPLSTDDSLFEEVRLFFDKIIKDKTLDHLLDKYHGNTSNLNYVGNCTYRLHIESRLPTYKKLFMAEGEKHAIDWRLLAAIGYQESHWSAEAVSPTGVKGLMMLTRGTAKQLGIIDRSDPEQSIVGGALYFKQRLKKIPGDISEPDKTWFALASYNVGFGHLEDARKLTEKEGGDPDKWLDVKKILPLLSEKKWYEQTRYGYARGKEPVRYVENIRSYYDLLVWLTEENQIEKNVMSLKPKKAIENEGEGVARSRVKRGNMNRKKITF